jgi:hypothetical protein
MLVTSLDTTRGVLIEFQVENSILGYSDDVYMYMMYSNAALTLYYIIQCVTDTIQASMLVKFFMTHENE